MAFPKYQTKELLNKILNSAETAIQVDVVAGAEYAEDSAHTHEDTGNFVLGVRNDTLAALGGADGDYVPFQMNASGALYVEVATLPASTSTIEVVGDAAENAAVAGNPVLVGGRYDSSGRTLGDGDVGAIALDADGAVHIADGGNTITVDGTVTANLGTTDNAVLDAIAASLALIDNAIPSGSELQVDVVASLPAGDNNIGNVDIVTLPASTNTIEVVGDAAENAAAAGNPVLVGGRYDSPGNDNSTQRTLGNADVGALALDPTGAVYVREALGQAGSCFVSGTSAVTAAYGKFVAIQFLEDTVFNSSNGLVATDTGRWPDDSGAASDVSSSNTAAVGSQVFPQGMTIFGRWDSFILASGAVIAYIGNV